MKNKRTKTKQKKNKQQHINDDNNNDAKEEKLAAMKSGQEFIEADTDRKKGKLTYSSFFQVMS